jgi:hypothetical protein
MTLEYWLYRFLLRFSAMNRNQTDSIALRMHGSSEIAAYRVTEDTLRTLEAEGGNVGYAFQIMLGCYTASASLFASILLASIPQGVKGMILVSLCVSGFAGGTVALLLWRRTRSTFSQTIATIRAQPEIGATGDDSMPAKPGYLISLPSSEAPVQQLASIQIPVDDSFAAESAAIDVEKAGEQK